MDLQSIKQQHVLTAGFSVERLLVGPGATSWVGGGPHEGVDGDVDGCFTPDEAILLDFHKVMVCFCLMMVKFTFCLFKLNKKEAERR